MKVSRFRIGFTLGAILREGCCPVLRRRVRLGRLALVLVVWGSAIPAIVAEAAEFGSTPGVWRPIGPAPIRVDDPGSALFEDAVGGVVYDIAIDPRGSSDRIIYLATNGGIWKSIDGGASWDPKTDGMPSNSTGAVALDPDDPDTVYAGTGTLIDPLGINFKAAGLYKSSDGGDTWTVLGRSTFGAPTTCAATRNTTCGLGVSRIAVPTGMSNVVLVGTNNGLFRSTNSGAPPWVNVLAGNITDLDIDTAMPSTVYASVAGVGILRSVDAGATFTRNLLLRPGAPAAGTFGTIAFAQSTAQASVPNNRIMYVNVAASTPCMATSCRPLGIWKSVDFGRSWARARATGLGNCQSVCAIDQIIGVDPVNPQIVHVGLINHYVSSDGGRLFIQEVDMGHVDQVAIAFSPPQHHPSLFGVGLPASPVWIGNHGGVWRGLPQLPTCVPIFGCTYAYRWDSRNEGLADLGIVSTDIGRGGLANNGYSYAGVWDNELVSKRPTDPGNDWHPGYMGGDGGFVTADPNNPLRAYGSSNSILFVTDTAGGDGWTARPSGTPPFDGPPSGSTDLTDTVWRTAIDASSRGDTAPFTSRRVYALVERQVYRSTDAGINFLPTTAIPSAGSSNFPRAIAVSASDPNVVWLGMTDGTLAYTDDALSGLAWKTPPSQPALAAPRPVASLAMNPHDPSQIVVGYAPDAAITRTTQPVWLTTDSGNTWTDISGNLPAVPVNSVVIDPSTSPASIIVANDNGVLYTTDPPTTGAIWLPLGTGLPTAYAMQLAHDSSVVPQLVRVGTYGRSVFELTGPVTDLQAGLRHEPEPVLGPNLTYHLFITNAGPEPAFGVVGQLELDPALDFVSGAGCSASPSGPNLVTCRVSGVGASPEHGEGVQIDVVAHLKTCPPDRKVTSSWSVGSLLLSDTVPANNDADDTATFICLPDTFFVSVVDGAGVEVPYFGKTTSTSIKFTFTGSDAIESFECSLDHANFTPCTSPATYDDLVSGDHTFQVQAIDANGNRDPTPATHVWSVV